MPATSRYNISMEEWRKFTLREFLNIRLKAIELEIRMIRRTIQKMGDIKERDFEQLKLQVASLSEQIIEIENRVVELERHSSIATWLARHTISAGVILGIVWILQNLPR